MSERWTVTHDFMFVRGGAENVTMSLARDVLGDSEVRYLSGNEHVISDLHLPAGATHVLPRRVVTESSHRLLAPLYPAAIAQLKPIDGNVIASSYAFAHHFTCTGLKVVYCHSPMRQIWSGSDLYKAHYGRWSHLTRPVLAAMRRRDIAAALSADAYVATGEPVARRLRDYYGMVNVPIIEPPVDGTIFRLAESSNPGGRRPFVWVGRITEPYKGLSRVLEAFRELPDEELVVVGEGKDRARLEASSPSNVTFVGWKSHAAIAKQFSGSEALIFSSPDDYGLVAVEAMSTGLPVLALRREGPAYTITGGHTGLFFEDLDIRSITRVVRDYRRQAWDRTEIARTSQRFGTERFVAEMHEFLNRIARERRSQVR